MNKLLPVLGVIVGCGCIAGSAYAANTYLVGTAPKVVSGHCASVGRTHLVGITKGRPSVSHTYAALCDVLQIVNHDNRLRLMAFGQHDHHQAYDGITEKLLQQGQSLSVVLNKPGTYEFHDHLDDTSIGYFTVGN